MNRLPLSLSRYRRSASLIATRASQTLSRSSKHDINQPKQSVVRTLDSILDQSLNRQVQKSISDVSRLLHNSPLDRRRPLLCRDAFDKANKPTIDRIVDQALNQGFTSHNSHHRTSLSSINQSLKSPISHARQFSSLRSLQQLIGQSINRFSSASDGSRGPSMALPFAPLKPANDEDVNDPLKAFSQQRSDPVIDSTKQPELALNFPALNDLPATATQPVTESPPVIPEQAIIYQPSTTERSHNIHDVPAAAQSQDDMHLTQSASAQTSNIDSVAGTSAAPAAVHDHHSVNAPTSQSVTEKPVDLGPAATDSHSNLNTSVASESTSQTTATSVPAFLRPAELSMLDRIRLHPLFQHWPNIGYIISACATLVSDILWLRSLLICANFFGIAVNYKFNFWTGIYWNIFFIFANLVQILLILFDRRGVVMNDEEQALFDNVFSEAYSPQEFRKLLQCGEFAWLEPGTELMRQGKEIHDIYLIAQGTAVVDEETKVRKEKKPVAVSEPSVIEETISRSPSLLSYVFGTAEDDYPGSGVLVNVKHSPSDEPETPPSPSSEVLSDHSDHKSAANHTSTTLAHVDDVTDEPQAPINQLDTPASTSVLPEALPVDSEVAEVAEPVKKKKKMKKKKKRFKSITTSSEPPLDAGAIGADETDMELQVVRLGLLGPGRLVGEMSLLSSVSSVSGGSSSTSAVAKATVTCADRCRVLQWPRDKLRALFFKHPSLAVGWYSIVSTDLVTRLSEAKRVSSKSGYRLFLLGCCGEGSVTAKQKSAAEEYRRLHGISGAEHEEMLSELGWTNEDWARGSQRVSWLQSLRVRRLLD